MSLRCSGWGHPTAPRTEWKLIERAYRAGSRGSSHSLAWSRSVGPGLCLTATVRRLLVDAASCCISCPLPIMSTVPSTSTSHSDFATLFSAALESYNRKTKKDLTSHPLLPSFQSCDSSDAVLGVLRDQIPGFSESQNTDDGLTKWVAPTVNVLYSFSATLGGVVGLVNIRMFSREDFLLYLLFRHFLQRT